MSVPVVTPMVLLVAPVAALTPRPITPGWRGGVGAGVFFCVGIGVGFVPSALVMGLEGVVVVPVVVFLAAGVGVGLDFEAGTAMFLMFGPLVVGLAVGKVFFVPIGVRVEGFEALSTAVFAGVTAGFFTGVAVDGVFVGVDVFVAGVADVVAFFTAVGALVATGVVVFFTGVGFVVVSEGLVVVDFAGVVRVSFAGALRTGVDVFVAVAVVFFFAAAGVPVVPVFAGVVAGFFAVCCAPWATFEMLPTPA